MMNYVKSLGLLIIMLAVVLVSCPSIVFAAPPPYIDTHTDTDPGPGVTVTVGVTGDYTDAVINLPGNYPDVWLNGAGLDNIAAYYGYQAGAQAGGAAASGALQNSASNSNYSNVGSGMLPLPNISSDGSVASIDSPDTIWVPGWQGYFCPKTNTDLTVYKGAGCGGAWGVADGYPDMWSRRQIAGLAPEFRQQQAKMETTFAALAKLIAVSQNQDGSLINVNQVLQDHTVQLSILDTNLAKLEKEQQLLKAEIMQQKEESDRKMLILSIIFGSGMLGMAGYLVAITLHYRPRKVTSDRKGLISRPWPL